MAETVVVRELLAVLGIKDEAGQLEDWAQGLDNIKGLMEKAALAAAALVAGTAALVTTSAMAGNAAAKNADATATGVEEYQRLAHAMGLAGVEGEKLNAVLRMQNQRVQAARADGLKYIEAQNGVRVAIEDSNGNLLSQAEILANVADAMLEAGDAQEQLTIATSFFGEEVGSKMVSALKGGAGALHATMMEADALGAVISEEQARESEAFIDNLARLGDIAAGLRNELAEDLLPVLNDFLRGLRDWFEANRKLIVQQVEMWARGIAEAFDAIVTIGRGIVDVIENTVGLDRVLAALSLTAVGLLVLLGAAGIAGAIAALVSALLALNPIGLAVGGVVLLLGAGLAAAVAHAVLLGLAIEDLMAFLQGGNSALGEFIDQNRNAEGVLGATIRAFDALISVGVALGDLLGLVFQPLIDRWGPEVEALFIMLGGLIEQALVLPLEMVADVLNSVAAGLEGLAPLLEALGGPASALGQALGALGGTGSVDLVTGGATTNAGLIADQGVAISADSLGSPGSTSNSTTQNVQVGGVSVETAAGASVDDVVDAALAALEAQIRQAYAALDGGER